jgi:hypothetical protein
MTTSVVSPTYSTSSNTSNTSTTNTTMVMMMTYTTTDSAMMNANVSVDVYIDVAVNIYIDMADMTSVVVGAAIVV